MPAPHKHAEVIKAWADGQQIEYSPKGINVWYPLEEFPIWHPGCRYRIKPAAPKWPQTTMSEEELTDHLTYRNFPGEIGGTVPSYTRLANVAIAHACESGALVPADKVREIEAKARAEGMMEGSKWDGDRDRMVIRETLNSQGISWTPHLVDHVIHRLPK